MTGNTDRSADYERLNDRMSGLQTDLGRHDERIKAIEKQLPDFVTTVQFKLVQSIVYLTCGTILLAVLGAWIAKVVAKA